MITEEKERERVSSIQSLVKSSSSSSSIGKVSQCQWHLNLNRVIHISNEVKVEGGGVAVAKSGGVGKAPH